jgi:hypothetical protein
MTAIDLAGVLILTSRFSPPGLPPRGAATDAEDRTVTADVTPTVWAAVAPTPAGSTSGRASRLGED